MPPLEDVIKEVSSCTLPEEDKVSVCVKLRQAFTLTANKVKAQTRNGKCIGNQETVRYKLSVVDKNQTILSKTFYAHIPFMIIFIRG